MFGRDSCDGSATSDVVNFTAAATDDITDFVVA
jgi:hypothetical protein